MSHLPVQDKEVIAESVVLAPVVPKSTVEATPGQPEDEDEVMAEPEDLIVSPRAKSDSSGGTFPPGYFTWHSWFAGTELAYQQK
jgi:hypothetical protein